ncbi:hypothetical protein BHE74_00003561 [Ensete ventricosum]|nr:hypothetical protein BHE74_00003561 [Ensete ventricosum]
MSQSGEVFRVRKLSFAEWRGGCSVPTMGRLRLGQVGSTFLHKDPNRVVGAPSSPFDAQVSGILQHRVWPFAGFLGPLTAPPAFSRATSLLPSAVQWVGRVPGKGFAYFTSVGVADVADRLHDLALHVTGSWSVILSSKVHRVELRSWVSGNGCDQAEDLGHLD